MARPRKHESDAERQRAYRERTVTMDRGAYDALQARLEALHGAVARAAARGNPLAVRCRSASVDTLLDNLTSSFEDAVQK